MIKEVFTDCKMPLARGEAVECGRNHTQMKPQVKHAVVLDHKVLSTEAVLISKITFIYKSPGSFCDFHEK